MAFINTKLKEVSIKIVYCGPGRGGKTTNLEYIYNRISDRVEKKMVSIQTHGDRTLFFDFLPLEIGEIMGYDIKTQLYTVPGQVKYNATRKVVLKGADGIVFVADSSVSRRKHNLISLKNLQENLAEYNIDIFKIPLILQYNKQDLAKQGIPVLPLEVMEKDLNSKLKAISFTASALNGENVIATIKKAISKTVISVKDKLS